MTKKHKVLIVHNYYQIPGGEDTVVSNEKKMLENNSHEVVMYTRHNNELKELSLLQKLCLPICTIFNPRTYREIKKIIREQSIDIVHVHNTLNLISPAVYYAVRKCKVPVVQTIHNFRLLCPGATFYRDGHICEDCVEKGLWCAVKHGCYRGSKLQTLLCVISTKIHRLTRIYEKINYICLTEFNKEKLLQLKQVNADRVFVKPNFVENDLPIIPYEERENYFVYAGRLDKLKGIDVLLEAWKIMGKEAPRLLVAGGGPMEEWCKNYIAENKLTNVEMLGFVNNEEVRKLLGKSKGLILPTQWYEGFPMTIVEAFSMGTPVYGSNMGNVGSLIKEKVSGTKFGCNSAKELVNAIRQLEKDNQLSETTYNEYAQNYSREKNYEIYVNIMANIEDKIYE